MDFRPLAEFILSNVEGLGVTILDKFLGLRHHRQQVLQVGFELGSDGPLVRSGKQQEQPKLGGQVCGQVLFGLFHCIPLHRHP